MLIHVAVVDLSYKHLVSSLPWATGHLKASSDPVGDTERDTALTSISAYLSWFFSQMGSKPAKPSSFTSCERLMVHSVDKIRNFTVSAVQENNTTQL